MLKLKCLALIHSIKLQHNVLLDLSNHAHVQHDAESKSEQQQMGSMCTTIQSDLKDTMNASAEDKTKMDSNNENDAFSIVMEDSAFDSDLLNNWDKFELVH